MEKIAAAFEDRGFVVVNVDYPSRKHKIEVLAPKAIDTGVDACPSEATIHFVTHSLGGILLRYYHQEFGLPRLGRVVMLAPPNHGSEVVDRYRKLPGFRALNGPAGEQLGTGSDGIASQLEPVDFELGVIAGARTFNPVLSQVLPNPDDGKVSVASTKVDGMTDFLIVPHSHPFIMRASIAIEQSVSFVETGKFADVEAR